MQINALKQKITYF